MVDSNTDNLSSANPQNFRLVFPIIPVSTDLSDNKDLTLNIQEKIIKNIVL